ncbi:hypothetical protein RBB77_10420 [Tunturibacter psychrotolerans]|uniref:Uncharacterized protein n=1 Tax=Tunturiibacter psychrotolerans TaxID=3069686 RepID=A0AAU7ZW82_9BACT
MSDSRHTDFTLDDESRYHLAAFFLLVRKISEIFQAAFPLEITNWDPLGYAEELKRYTDYSKYSRKLAFIATEANKNFSDLTFGDTPPTDPLSDFMDTLLPHQQSELKRILAGEQS